MIIGILAAVAVPQYQKAVEKARFAEVLVNVNAWVKAQQLYYLEHGELGDLEGLSIDFDLPDYETALETGAPYSYSVEKSSANWGWLIATRMNGPYEGQDVWWFVGSGGTLNSLGCSSSEPLCKMAHKMAD